LILGKYAIDGCDFQKERCGGYRISTHILTAKFQFASFIQGDPLSQWNFGSYAQSQGISSKDYTHLISNLIFFHYLTLVIPSSLR